MPLVFNRNLNKDNWIIHNNVPSKSLLNQYQYCFNNITKNTFKKMTPDFDQVIFDRESKHSKVILMDDYVTCTSGVNGSHRAIGIKSLPLKKDKFQLFNIKVKSVNNGSPLIGFCDKDKTFKDDKLSQCVMWNINEPFIRYYRNNNIELSNKTFYINPLIFPNDVLNIAIDNENNLMWIGVNYQWTHCRPNKLDTGAIFIPDDMKIEDPVLYVIPSGWEFELIKYEKFKPSYYLDAVSLPVTDWYLVNKYMQEGLL